jgi:GAF domain-containing protein
MFDKMISFLQAPKFEDPEKNIQSQNMNLILRGLLVLTILFLIYSIFSPIKLQIIIAVVAIGFEIGLIALLRGKQLQLVGMLFTTFLWLAVLVEVVLYGGIRDTGYASFTLVIVIAALTIGARTGIFFTIMTILAGAVLAYSESRGWLPKYAATPIWTVLTSYTITFAGSSLLINLAIRGITLTARKALEEERLQKEINLELETSHAELKNQTDSLEHRNTMLQMVAELPKLIGQTKNEQEFLSQAIDLLVGRTQMDHAAIYLLNQLEENAYLRTTNSTHGKDMLNKGYQLRVVHSEVTYNLFGIDVLNFKVGNSSYQIDRPESLPNYKTNLCFPLISGDHLLGLLNVQSLKNDPESIDQPAFQTFADQIALSIENLRLLSQLQSNVREVSLLAGQTVISAWKELQTGRSIGYTYDQVQVVPMGETYPAEIARQLTSGKAMSYVTTEDNPRSRLIAPIVLRENVIGVIGYEDSYKDHEWQENEKTLLEAIASRVSLALENTRLVADAQLRAERERTVGQATAKMRETLDIESVLRTAVNEIKRSFNLENAEVRLQLTDPIEKPAPEREA